MEAGAEEQEEEEKAGVPSTTTARGNFASSDDSVRTSSSSSILKSFARRQMSDGSGSGTEASSPPRRGGRRRRLAFGRVTTHPFDAMEPSSLRFDHQVTVSEASADRWESLLRPAAAARRRRGQAHHPGGISSVRNEAADHNSRWAAEGMPQSPRRRGSVNALLGILDEVSLSLLTTSQSPDAYPSHSRGAHEWGDDEALVPGPSLTVPEIAAASVRPRGIVPLPTDLLRAASDGSSFDSDNDDVDRSHRPDEKPRPFRSDPSGGDDLQPRQRRKERATSLWHGRDPPAPTDKVSRVAPARHVGRRGSTLHAFLRDPLHRHAIAETKESSRLRSEQALGGQPLAGTSTGEEPPRGELVSRCNGGLTSLVVPTDGGKVQESTGSTQESDSDDEAAAISAGIQMASPSRFHFKSPLLRRRVGVRSSVRHTGPLASSDEAGGEGGRVNRSSMVTNLPSRTFSLAPANPCYRARDGLQATHRSAGKGGSFRRWTLVSILPSRKSRSSPSLVSQ